MGLDSVELVWEWEKYFSIKIPDRQAENILTIQDAADCIASHLELRDRNEDIIAKVFSQLKTALIKHGLKDELITPEQKVFQLIPAEDNHRWDEIEKAMDLSLPRPSLPLRINKVFRKMFGPYIDVTPTTVIRFVNLVCAANYEVLIDRNSIQNPLEVLLAVEGITINRLGVDAFEIYPDKSFTDDLGLD